MDRGSYEKLSIRESAGSLKRYGSTSKHVTRNENFLKHYVTNSDTLQGVALKYNVTIEQIRRANRLWASDSLFLREFLLIPSNEATLSSVQTTPVVSPTSTSALSPSSQSNNSSLGYDDDDEDNIDEFLNKIDAAIATTKEDVKKTTRNSEFASVLDPAGRRRPVISRMKHMANNNSPSGDMYQTPPNVIVQQGKKVRTSLKHHEQQQDELFQL